MPDLCFPNTNIFFRPNGPHAIGEGVTGDVHNCDHVSFCNEGTYAVKLVHPNGAEENGVLNEGHGCLIRKASIHTLTRIKTRLKPHVQKLVDAAIAAGLTDAAADFLAAEDAKPGRFVCLYSHRDWQGEVVEYFDGFMTAYT